jgi:hypothetical protein
VALVIQVVINAIFCEEYTQLTGLLSIFFVVKIVSYLPMHLFLCLGNCSCAVFDFCSKRDFTSPILWVAPPASLQLLKMNKNPA